MAQPPLRHSPWTKRDQWRYHPIFQVRNQVRYALPGFAWSTSVFAAYCVWEYFTTDPNAAKGHH